MRNKLIKLGEIYDVASGLSKSAKEFSHGGYPFVSFKTIFYNWFLPDELPDNANTSETERIKYSVHAGDVFLTRTSETADELAMSCVALKNYPNATFNGFSKRLRIKSCVSEHVYPKFIGYYLRSNNFRNQIKSMSIASTRASLNIEMINRLTIELPDIEMQKRIADFLYVIDSKIKVNGDINRNLLDQAKMLFQAWFIDYEHFGGECPSDWKEGILEDVVDFYNGYAFKSKELLDAPDPENECFHVFKQGHINRGGGFNISGTKSWFPKKNAEKLERYVLKKGDILMAMTDMKNNVAILGNTAVMEMDNTYILNQRVALLRATGKFGIEYPFVSLLTNSTDFVSDLRSRANSGVQVNLSATEIKNSKLLIPSEEVNLEFNSIVKPMFEAMIDYDMENMRLIELRDTLLPKLMSGEMDVSDLDF